MPKISVGFKFGKCCRNANASASTPARLCAPSNRIFCPPGRVTSCNRPGQFTWARPVRIWVALTGICDCKTPTVASIHTPPGLGLGLGVFGVGRGGGLRLGDGFGGDADVLTGGIGGEVEQEAAAGGVAAVLELRASDDRARQLGPAVLVEGVETFGDPGTVGGDGAGEEIAAGERGLGGEGERDAGEVGQRGGDVGEVHGVGADAGGETGGDEEERPGWP